MIEWDCSLLEAKARIQYELENKEYPNACVFATTLREVLNANEHHWGAIVREGDDWEVINPRPIQVLDRIGGGDGFVPGALRE